jgi:L-2-hydroxyglutarate oxidase LhgO
LRSRFFAAIKKIVYKKAMERVDVTVIGAGVIGLAIAAEIAKPGLNVYILEKNAAHGTGISSRNSEVVHSGIYYPEGSLKATLCVTGRQMLYDLAVRNKIPHKKTGKLIVAVNPEEIEEIEWLYANGHKNEVISLSIISKQWVAKMEPNIKAFTALHSPDTGIISAHDLMNYYLACALSKKALIVYHTKVVRIEKEGGGYRICTHNESGKYFEFHSEVVINAAGLESDTIANMIGGNYQLYYCKGNYCGISGAKQGVVQRLIYPVPDKQHIGLGIHLTIDLNGRLKLGPDTIYIPRVENYNVEAEITDRFYQSARKFLPFLKEENVHPDMAGIRPKLQGPDDDFRDFVIKEDSPGFINLVGIESPGLTASPAIARYVKNILDGTCAPIS